MCVRGIHLVTLVDGKHTILEVVDIRPNVGDYVLHSDVNFTYVHTITPNTQIDLKNTREYDADLAHEMDRKLTLIEDEGEKVSQVVGLDDVLQVMRELIDVAIHRREELRKFGIRPPQGVLLFGPPGYIFDV